MANLKFAISSSLIILSTSQSAVTGFFLIRLPMQTSLSVFTSMIMRSPTLTSLDLSGNSFGVNNPEHHDHERNIRYALCHNTSLRKLNLANNKLDIVALLPAKSPNVRRGDKIMNPQPKFWTNLEVLDLSGNKFSQTDDIVAYIFDSVEHHCPALKELFLENI